MKNFFEVAYSLLAVMPAQIEALYTIRRLRLVMISAGDSRTLCNDLPSSGIGVTNECLASWDVLSLPRPGRLDYASG